LARAIAIPNSDVILDGASWMDMSGYDSLPIESGVRLMAKAGATLLTNSSPAALFTIGKNREAARGRVSGIVFSGSDYYGDGQLPTSTAIAVYSSVGVEIDHNVIAGFTSAGVSVQDLDTNPRRKLTIDNPSGVWIHDNFIHNCSHVNSEGAGVRV